MFKNKLTILFFVVIIIPIFIYFLFNNYFWKKTQIQSKNIFSENQNEDIEKNLNLKETKELNKMQINNNIYLEATKNKDQQKCFLLKSEKDKYLCIKNIAIQTLNKDLCGLINNKEEQNFCLRGITTLIATKEKNLSLCAELNDEQDQLTCIKKITEQNIAIGDCDQIPLRFFDLEDKKNIGDIELRNVCKSEVIYKKAVSDNNVFLCESIISNAIKIKCFGKLGNIPLNSDYDNDGLIYQDEIMYGSNPNIFDTDGDGYGDGDEVKKMYSPIGGGGLFKLN
ncbi:hypothetical protein A2331_05270 [Candidatus Falkowbacteria bacterium RIFOXYB2_FULL_34_18]|uniref:Uncharacterized protein n=1 Tax=Candidatus Falkowbacteria bacterium RIFOXYD2_FULL_34_120 TaxID=1798007 RepID=A0A1F5TNI2_9BACT|nr:MAG: hypothetical protein A2500_06975 [Candidatus Falkowbacteria bacterium RIFOXYC12_FULL_34_55]OGF28753.1 MAG: hypothetical protein A2331_05270 [Candidatus Falkowbacteria bacterium RIFOXYB2_FULL_34_18]OGF38118.1 MAG: hypothetical protein A2466_04450 [Candidatus Falkowbacteria bacterium RIFOXYC2_FULL_34_220]OGF38372.1 MAG: hypothetical protein A2515_06480 [Candidatus Falkowbacteria bacterium RIFOXYD12_FULL_34_57]OGF40359.1 MAG: hypothetical protein A2531_00740 [Candidatus Falkowbacteria bact